MRKRKEYLDERQQIERGKAFRNAFITVLAALFVCCAINWVSEKPVLGYGAIMLIPFWLSVSVFLTTVIMHDALFINNNDNQARSWLTLAICWGITGLCLLGISAIGLRQPINGNGSMSITQMLMGICMIEISAVYLVKRVRDKREAKLTEEPDQIAE